jgi:pimeloyl-ACP methyl ester carboxylesterase
MGRSAVTPAQAGVQSALESRRVLDSRLRGNDDATPFSAASRREGAVAVLLLHRAGASSWAWRPHLDALGAEIRAVALDLPGHGESPGPALASIEAMADVAGAAIERLGLGRAVVAGHSMGGAVALSLAQRRPELVAGVLMLCSGARLRVAAPLLEAVRAGARPELMARFLFSRGAPKEVVDAHLPRLFDAPPEVVATDMEACDRFDGEPGLPGLAVPVRLIAGTEDVLTPPRLSRRLAERAADAKIRVVAGAGHMLPLEHPQVVVEELRALAAAVAEGGRGA